MISLLAGLFLAFSNGANDNFKGVATLLGSKTTSYKVALVWATFTTFAGSMLAFYLAEELLHNFSGRGLVPDVVAQLPAFSVSIALASGITVFLATKLGFPISTTHGIVGALVGTGFIASPTGVNLDKLYSSFFLPLLTSPVIAILGTIIIYSVFSFSRNKTKVKRESCICIGNQVLEVAPIGLKNGTYNISELNLTTSPSIEVGTMVTCEEKYTGSFLGINAKSILDSFHFLSSGAVGFARGLNDTPKIAAILLSGNSVSGLNSIGLVAIVMALGGIIYAKKIAKTMSYQITTMNDGQGFSANFVTSIIVIAASKLGMPVSTTHVSCGSLFGIGIITKEAHWKMILKIILSWITTLPLAALLGYVCFLILRNFI